ncbi:MAG: hypothetical protein ABJD07_08525 [Gemmatimonadaceae bacterium]
MRYRTLVLVPAAAIVAACAGKDRASSSGANDDLKRDLALASSPGLELANGSRANTQIVSAIERVASAAPQGRTAPRPKPKSPESAPAPVAQVAEAPASTVVAVTPEPAPAPGPSAPDPVMAGGRPHAPVMADGPVAGGDGRGQRDGGWGGTGVIIRGGTADGDHCDPRGGRRGRGGNIGGMIGMIGMGGAGRLGGPMGPVFIPADTFPRR